MAILGRGAGGLLNLKTSAEVNSNASNVGGMVSALRTSIQVLELGATVTSGTVNTNGNIDGSNGFSIRIFAARPGVAAALLATKAIPVSTTVGSEFTTRDGSLTWQSDFANAADRVFPKGTKIYGMISETGVDGDKITFYCKANEYGAPPN